MELEFLPKKAFMLEALRLAREAANAGEVPVGAVVVRGDEVIGRGRNRREAARNALAHAEIEAIDEACRALHTWRLTGCHLYVTLEPCPMCAGAILNARIERVIYGPDDEQSGCMGTVCDLSALPYATFPHIYRGFCEEECRSLLQLFFRNLRKTP